MLEDEAEDIHEKLFFRHKFMKRYNKLKERGVKYKSLTTEELLMLFIYHPASVAHARKFRESIKEFKVGLDLLKPRGKYGAHIHPIEECARSMLKMSKFSAVPSSDDQFIKNIMPREGLYLPTHFYRVHASKAKATASVFWYFTHPMNIPSILKNGITIEDGLPAYFYSCFMTYPIAEHEFGVDQYCVTTKNGNKFFAALLVEVDIEGSAFTQSTPHMPMRSDTDHFRPCIQVGERISYHGSGGTPREYEISDTIKTKLKFNASDTRLVMVFDKSRIGAVRYFGIVLRHDYSAEKILNVSMENYYKRKVAAEASQRK
jgi:hypothetical protein